MAAALSSVQPQQEFQVCCKTGLPSAARAYLPLRVSSVWFVHRCSIVSVKTPHVDQRVFPIAFPFVSCQSGFLLALAWHVFCTLARMHDAQDCEW